MEILQLCGIQHQRYVCRGPDARPSILSDDTVTLLVPPFVADDTAFSPQPYCRHNEVHQAGQGGGTRGGFRRGEDTVRIIMHVDVCVINVIYVSMRVCVCLLERHYLCVYACVFGGGGGWGVAAIGVVIVIV